MPKFKRRSITVEAFHWQGYNPDAVPKWFVEAEKKPTDQPGACRVISNDTVKVLTPSGIMTAYKGDYIIRSDKGDLYPCNEKLFNFLHDEMAD